MAGSIFQSAKTSLAANSTTLAATLTNPPTAGNTVVAIVNSDTTFTIAGSPTATRVAFLGDQQFNIYEWTSSLPQTVTATLSPTDLGAITVLELAGVGAFDVVSTTTTINTVTTTINSATVTTTGANDFILTVVAIHGQNGTISTPTFNNSFVLGVSNITGVTGLSNPACSQFIGTKTQAAAGATGATANGWTSNAQNASAVHIAYLVAGAASAATPGARNFTQAAIVRASTW